jgi:hypothetical protein
VAAHEIAQSAPQRAQVEPAAEAKRRVQVVGGVARLQAVEDPEPLLGEGERRRARGQGGAMGGSSVAPRCSSASRAARAATVGRSKSSRSGTSKPSAVRNRDSAWMAAREWPPRSKKLSSGPSRAWPRMRAKTFATSSACGVGGGASGALAHSSAASGASAARAARSTLPLGVSGRAATSMKAAGIMYSGRVLRRWRRTRSRRSAADEAARAASAITR